MKKQINNFDISGKVLEVGKPEYINERFSKRILVMQVYSGKYANEVPFEFVNENMNQVESARQGDFVTVNFEIKARSKGDSPVRRYTSLIGISCYKE